MHPLAGVVTMHLGSTYDDERTMQLREVLYQVKDAAALVSQGVMDPAQVPAFRLPIAPVDDREQELADQFYEAMADLRRAKEAYQERQTQQVLQLEQLKRVQEGPPPPSRPLEPADGGSSTWTWVAVGGTAAAILAGAWFLFRRRKR